MNLEIIKLSEINQTQKATYYIHLYEMSRTVKSIETESTLSCCQRVEEKRIGVATN